MRVVVADDHPLFLVGLTHGLESAGAHVVAAVRDGEAAIDACRRYRPDAVLLDVRMPRRSGVDACWVIVGEGVCDVVALLTTWTDAHIVDAAREAGARAILSKEEDAGSIVAYLRLLRDDSQLVVFPSSAAPSLSHRELQVLDGLARGLSRKGIASELRLSPETVKDHVSALFAKLDARDRVTAVTQALQLGVMDLPQMGVHTKGDGR